MATKREKFKPGVDRDVLLLLAGLMLLTPGFVSDAIGFSLFLPPVRFLLKKLLGKTFE